MYIRHTRELVQTLSSRKRLQVSRLMPVPRRLGIVLGVVNQLPPLPGRNLFAESFVRGAPANDKFVKRYLKKWKAALAESPPDFQRLIGPITKITYPKVSELCWDLEETRKLLRDIARAEQEKKLFRYPAVGSYFRRGEDGRIVFVKGPTLAALEGVETRRIRECPICQKLFWAGRIDKKCCGPRCLTVWHSRKWREKYLASYKLQRIRKAEQRSRHDR